LAITHIAFFFSFYSSFDKGIQNIQQKGMHHMFQTSEDVIKWVHDRKKFGIKPGLERMEWMMEKLDHPERRLRAVHIGGTNGKGSTIAFLRSILQEGGSEVGTFTSPYVESFHERISVDGVPISDEDLIKVAEVIKPLAEQLETTDLGAPTEFEIITAMAFYYFARIHPVDILLVEVGLGGRLDSTNIIHPFVSVITSIGYDHMNILGDNLMDIAMEKAGIFKSGQPVITGVRNKEILEKYEEIVKENRTALYKLGEEFTYEDLGPTEDGGEAFTVKTLYKTYENLEISMTGRHQIENATLAVMIAEYLRQFYAIYLEEEHIREGLKKAYWPARFEVVSQKPTIILDSAHNKEGIDSLVETVNRHYPDKKGTILFTALKDKPFSNMIQALEKLGYPIFFTEIDDARAATAEALFETARTDQKEIVTDWKGFLSKKISSQPEDELIIVCGSIYFVSEVKSVLKQILH
jgi:dihydrofolate synthase / folylpolyglutamate synthase